MRKADLINEVSERTGVSKVDVLVTVEQALLTIKHTLANGAEVTLRGFGTFQPKHRAAKMGRNIKKGTQVHIPAHNVPHFKPAAEFKEKLRRPAGSAIDNPSF